jgi:hypothetical protein
MASLDTLTIRLVFRPAPLLTFRLKVAALIFRVGCFIGSGKAGHVEIEP